MGGGGGREGKRAENGPKWPKKKKKKKILSVALNIPGNIYDQAFFFSFSKFWLFGFLGG